METLMEVLLLHEGELTDVGGLLGELGVSWVEGRSAQSHAGSPGLVIGTPASLLRWDNDGHGAARIAVCDGGGRTVERKLAADGVDFILRRPVHPAALRLLIHHLIYRGPERRRLRRVSAAHPVKFRTGSFPGRLFSRKGLLLEFSVGGCQLLTQSALKDGQALQVDLPAELGLGRKLKVNGRVVRMLPAPAGSEREFVAAVDFGDLAPEVRQRLAAGVVARARRAPAPEPERREPEVQELDTSPRERRQQPRGHYTKAVHGKVGENTLVLMGSDLSPDGMHVEPEPSLSLGARLTLDLYGHCDIPPLRIQASVARDDGERGLYLAFQNLWPGAPALLERLIKTLPLIARNTENGLVITEVVERS